MTGKTLWKTLCFALRGRCNIFISITSGGIAYLLLPGGGTTHLRFNIPLNVYNTTTCSRITPDSSLIDFDLRFLIAVLWMLWEVLVVDSRTSHLLVW